MEDTRISSARGETGGRVGGLRIKSHLVSLHLIVTEVRIW